MSGDPHPFVVTERVRWADVDLVGIMRFSAFTRLVENAEQELMREAGHSYREIFQSPEVWLPRRHMSIDYFAPARIDDELRLLTYVSRLGDTSMTLNVDVMSGDRRTMHAAAVLVMVCVSVSDFRKRALPPEFRAQMVPFQVGADEARTWFSNATDD